VDKNLSDFLPNDEEITSLNEFQEEIHTYMIQKLALDSAESSKVFLNLQDYLSLTTANHTERSNVLYLDVMDAKSEKGYYEHYEVGWRGDFENYAYCLLFAHSRRP
jgi:hypothetical protein